MLHKKLIAFLLSVTMFFSMGISVFAATSPTKQENVSYMNSDDDFILRNGVLTQYIGNGGAVTIPSIVTSIGDEAFLNNNSITSVTIPNSVKSIGESAFENCQLLSSVKMANTITSIGPCAFYGCSSLTSINISSSLTEISGGMFMHCSGLKNVTIPNSVANIGISAFRECSNLKSVTIPNSVMSIGGMAFARSGVVSIAIPDSVTEIGEEAFYECKNLTSISLSNHLTSIKKYCFYGCENLSEIIIPSSVKSIGEYAFSDCRSITSLTIPGSVQTIEQRAFLACFKLCKVRLEYGVKTIGNHAFASCANGADNFSIIVPDSVTSVQSGAFNVGSKTLDLYYYGTQSQWSVIARDEIEYSDVDDYRRHFEYRPLTITKQPKNVTVTAGNSVNISVEATGKDVAYQWFYKKAGKTSWSAWNGQTRSTVSFIADTSWNGVQFYCQVSSSDGQFLKSNAVNLTVNEPVLKITSQPVSITTKANKLVKFSVKAEGIGLTYQWYYKKSGQSSWNIWREYYTSVIQPPANNTWDGMQVKCLVTDAAGKSIFSNSATVTIVPYSASDFQISSQPKSVSISSEDVGKKQISFSVAAKNGSDLKYQWYYCKAGDNSWNVWKGRINPTESVIPNSTWNGIQLYCRITNNDGDTLYSDLAKVTIIDSTLSITTQPVNKTVTLGNSVTLSLKAQGVGLSYQWYFKKAGQTSWTAWSGRTHASETVIPNSTWNGIQLYCLVKDSSGNSVKSNTIKVTVNGTLSITTQPVSKTVTLGDSITLSLKAQGVGLSYQWYYKKAGQTTWSVWSGRTHASETVTPNSTWNGIQLYCLVKDSSGNSVKSNTIKVTVSPSPLITPGEYRCYEYSTGRGSFDYDDFKTGNTITLKIYSNKTATMYSNLYWDEGDYYDHTENTLNLTYDNNAFYYSDGDVFCNYHFNENVMHLDLWYMDFDSYSFVIEKYY